MKFVKFLMTRIARLVSLLHSLLSHCPLPAVPVTSWSKGSSSICHGTQGGLSDHSISHPALQSLNRWAAKRTSFMHCHSPWRHIQWERERGRWRDRDGVRESVECITSAWTHVADINVFVHRKLDDGQDLLLLLLKILSHLTAPSPHVSALASFASKVPKNP